MRAHRESALLGDLSDRDLAGRQQVFGMRDSAFQDELMHTHVQMALKSMRELRLARIQNLAERMDGYIRVEMPIDVSYGR